MYQGGLIFASYLASILNPSFWKFTSWLFRLTGISRLWTWTLNSETQFQSKTHTKNCTYMYFEQWTCVFWILNLLEFAGLLDMYGPGQNMSLRSSVSRRADLVIQSCYRYVVFVLGGSCQDITDNFLGWDKVLTAFKSSSKSTCQMTLPNACRQLSWDWPVLLEHTSISFAVCCHYLHQL